MPCRVGKTFSKCPAGLEPSAQLLELEKKKRKNKWKGYFAPRAKHGIVPNGTAIFTTGRNIVHVYFIVKDVWLDVDLTAKWNLLSKIHPALAFYIFCPLAKLHPNLVINVSQYFWVHLLGNDKF